MSVTVGAFDCKPVEGWPNNFVAGEVFSFLEAAFFAFFWGATREASGDSAAVCPWTRAPVTQATNMMNTASFFIRRCSVWQSNAIDQLSPFSHSRSIVRSGCSYRNTLNRQQC